MLVRDYVILVNARHTSWYTLAFLQTNVPEFIQPANWPPNSPGLNHVQSFCVSCLLIVGPRLLT